MELKTFPAIFQDKVKKLNLNSMPATPHTVSQSIGGTGVSPVQAQANACGYHTLLFDCNSV